METVISKKVEFVSELEMEMDRNSWICRLMRLRSSERRRLVVLKTADKWCEMRTDKWSFGVSRRMLLMALVR